MSERIEEVCGEAVSALPADPEVLAAAGASRGATIARNVAANWAGHMVSVISGFVLPRFINDHIGQERLGVWDFGWSTVAYLSLLNAGISASVNRYVARHRATGDWTSLNRAATSCGCIFMCMGAIATLIVIALVLSLSRVLPESFAAYLSEARWLLLLLGLSSAVNLALPVYNGVITGYERYDLVTYIEASCVAICAATMIVGLAMGRGLKMLAWVVLATTVLEGVWKFIVAHRVCPQLKWSVRLVTRSSIWEVSAFGGKLFLDQMGRMMLYQGNNLLVAWFLGPASLAVYARSMALVAHTNKILFHFGRVLTPSVSSLQALQGGPALARLVEQGARFSLLIVLPITILLTVLGDSLLRVWMGPGFALFGVLPALALGHLAYQAQSGAYHALVGMNRHGKPSVAMLLAAPVSLGFTALGLAVFHKGLFTVALSVGLPLTVVNVAVVPAIAARAIGVPLGRYFKDVTTGVVGAVLPFAGWLVLARFLCRGHDVLVLLVGAIGGGLVLSVCYWYGVLPESLKSRVQARLGRSTA